jgi:serine/threonine-protein kinase
MGTVFLARMAGSAGFSRLVAIKRLLPELAAQKEFVAMLVDEARLASSLHHANIVDTLDLVATDGAFSLVLEYVEGAALSVLTREVETAGDVIPRPIVMSMVSGLLRGLDAAHEARSPEGTPLGIVHRDISPQNVLVGTDGVPRIIDFGIAKAMGRVVQTRPGEVRGKFAYMAPEQLLDRPATRQADVYAAGVVLWELLTGDRLFQGDDQRAVCAAVMRGEIKPPSTVRPDIPKALDDVVMRATARETSERYYTAGEFLADLAQFERAPDDDVGRWVRATAAVYLAKRAEMLQDQHPEHSRSVDDLMAELQASATPSDGGRASKTPPTPRPVLRAVTGTVPLPLSPLPEPASSARGLTAPAVVMANGMPAGAASKAGPFIAVAAFFAVLAIGLGVLVLRGREKTPAVNATPSAPVAVEPPPAPTETEAVEEPAIELASPTASASQARPVKKPVRWKPAPKKPASTATAAPFDHP